VGNCACFEAMNRAVTQARLRPIIDRKFAWSDFHEGCEPAPSGVDQLLWAIRAIGARSLAPVRQSDATGLDEAEVQALQSPQDSREPVFAKTVPAERASFRALAVWYDRRVCLMGAE
jgi:hypothetical protein